MALRLIIKEGDPLLRKHSRKVDSFNERLNTLLDDMADTLKKAQGVGLAAPQVGILRRVFIVDVGEGVIEFINPEIVYRSEELQTEAEGCLSSPGEYGMVPRPKRVKIVYQDRSGNHCELEGEGLMARALCHESDHLDGRLFKDLAERMLTEEELEDLG